MRVSELMTKSPSTCRPSDSAHEAAQIMWERDCGSVPIVDATGCAVGIVTDRDLCMAAYLKGRSLSSIAISEIMSGELCTVRPSDDLSVAEKLMRDHQIRRLPVVDDGGCVIGMLSFSDVTTGVAHNGAPQRDGQDVFKTITAISEPRSGRQAST